MRNLSLILLVICCLHGFAFADDLEERLEEIPLEESLDTTPDGKRTLVAPVDIPQGELIAALLARLNLKDEGEVLKAGVTLRQVATRADVPRLVAALQDGREEQAQVLIVEALAEIRDRRAASALRFEILHGKDSVKEASIIALGKLKSDWPIPLLQEVLIDPARPQRQKMRAIAALGEIASPTALTALEAVAKRFTRDDLTARRALTWSLGKTQGEYPETIIDTDLPAGRTLTRNYRGMKYHLYHPALRTEKTPKPKIIVCVHGADLNVDGMFNGCLKWGKEQQMVVIAPLFDPVRFIDYSEFNIRSGERSDKRMFALIEYIATTVDAHTTEIYFFGFEEGGDFVHRLALSYPERMARVAFYPKRTTMPDETLYFPAGTRPTPLAPDVIPDFRKFARIDAVALSERSLTTSGRTEALKVYLATEDHRTKHGWLSRLCVVNVTDHRQLEGAITEAGSFLFANRCPPE